jgi:hypothetical protein
VRPQSPAWLAGCLALLLSAVLSVPGQGTFQNLGFESATLIPIGSDPHLGVQFGSAFPGWTAEVGGVQLPGVLYDNANLDHSGISIIDSQSPVGSVIQGNFTAVLQAGLSPSDPTQHLTADTTLAQTGLIPFGTQSLLFRANLFGPSDAFDVTLGGQVLSFTPLANGANYTLYGADVHAWAGQTTELAFTAIAENPYLNDIHSIFLDSIQFSTQVIPEPGVSGLSALGALVLAWRMRGWRSGAKVPSRT